MAETATTAEWKKDGNVYFIEGRECRVFIQPRPHYCDRGNFVTYIDARGRLALDMDGADGWPRYFFDLDRAKAEIVAWLTKRRQL